MKPEIHWIPGPWPGRLGILLRPRGGDWLSDEVRMWREAGLDVVASLLTEEEIAELGLREEAALSRDQGLEFHAFPIPDRGVPGSRAEAAELAARLEKTLAGGKNVAVHCRQGVGRSALIAALVLVAGGEKPKKALRSIQEARGTPVPDTTEQQEWVHTTALETPAAVVSTR